MQFQPQTMQTQWRGPLGPMLLAVSPAGLAGLWFTDQKHLPVSSLWPVLRAKPPVHQGMPLAQTQAQSYPAHAQQMAWAQQSCSELAEYFAGTRSAFSMPLDISGGTAFQQAVWQGLLAIPCGEITSYGALAAAIGKPAAVRALGAAVGHNPLSIIVPCHRVIGADGSLTGYAGGLARKTALLQHEGVLPEGLL